MADVFLSYSRENQAVVARLAAALSREGYKVWWDAEVPPHRPYGDVIAEEIGGAHAVIVVWSERAARSHWVRAEADLAREQRKLIQVSVDDHLPPMPFNQIQCASIAGWDGRGRHPGWEKVRASLAALRDGIPPRHGEGDRSPPGERGRGRLTPAGSRSSWFPRPALAAGLGLVGAAALGAGGLWLWNARPEAGTATRALLASAGPRDGKFNLRPSAPRPAPVKAYVDGDIPAHEVAAEHCQGMLTEQPNVSMTVTDTARPVTLAILPDPGRSVDTTLAVRGPDGVWICVDDVGENPHPSLSIASPRRGHYDIWVGRHRGSQPQQVRLAVT